MPNRSACSGVYSTKPRRCYRRGSRVFGHITADAEPHSGSFGDAAKEIGVSEPVLQDASQIVENTSEPVREAIRDAPLADNKSQLIAPARLDEPQQKVVDHANYIISTTFVAYFPAARRWPEPVWQHAGGVEVRLPDKTRANLAAA